MKRLALIAAAVLTVLLPSSGRADGFLRTRGKELVDANGRTFRIKGVNLGNWLAPEGYMLRLAPASAREIDTAISELIGPAEAARFWKRYLDDYVTEADVRYLKSIGANTVRVPFNYKLFTEETYLGASGDARGFALLDRLIGWCRKNGVYVILDMHAAPGGQTGDDIDDGYDYPFLLENEDDQKRLEEIWSKLAKRYRDEPTILGYDLLNEPIGHQFDVGILNPKLEPLYRRITRAVRAVDSKHIVILGGAQWDKNFKVFGPPFDANVVYEFHKYWMPPIQAEIQEYMDYRDRYGVPIYMGESGENTDEWVEQFRRLLDAQSIGWTFWPYKRMRKVRTMVPGAFDSSLMQVKTPDDYDLIEQYAAAPRTTSDEVRKARPKDRAKVRQSLETLLLGVLYENCAEMSGYRKALGF